MQIKQLEEDAAAPFVYIREIPNKPPPPYVPPAHGSPMTAIFPSDARIQELVYRRVDQLIRTNNGIPSACNASDTTNDENITNIYERIALDICAEYLSELPKAAIVAAPAKQSLQFKQPLAFYNPPDRLECMQQHVLLRVKKLLRHPPSSSSIVQPLAKSNDMPVMTAAGCDHPTTVVASATDASFDQAAKRVPVGGVSSELVSGSSGSGVGAAKRQLWWNEILLHDMMEDDATWTNFDTERSEVLQTVTDEIVGMLVAEALVDCERAFNSKLKGSGASVFPEK